MDPGKPRYPRNEGIHPSRRITRSATWSNSRVVIPGRAADRTASWALATQRPAISIFLNWAGVLRVITAKAVPIGSLEGRHDPLGYPVNVA